MYEPFYGLRERPFDLSPNPLYLFMTNRHAEALTTLTYGISARKGIALVIGEAGTGKTTLVHAALGTQEGRNALGVCLSNPTLTRTEFFEFLAHGFGLGPFTSKTTLLHSLRKCLTARHQKKAATALIIDEAQSLSDELLEEVRLLANIETTTDKLLSVVLLGQPELSARLNQAKLLQLKQRVAMRAVLAPLNSAECSAYISKRIAVAGGDGTAIFSEAAVQEVFRHSGGIPRAINVICDNSLVSGFALDRRVIDRDVVLEVCRDLDFKAGDRPTPAKPIEPAPKTAPAAVPGTPVAAAPRPAAERPIAAGPATAPKEENIPSQPDPPKRRWFGVFGGSGRTQPISVTGVRR